MEQVKVTAVDGTEFFTPLAKDYARYRPAYPREVLGTLEEVCGLAPDWAIADIGSGTGNLSRLFLANGYGVTGIEPNREMRREAERLLAPYPAFRSLEGAAEQVPLRPLSVDLVTVGQALHWFDADRARDEFRRILRPGGWVAVLWNDRSCDATGFAQEYRSLTCARGLRSPCAPPSLSAGLDRLLAASAPREASFPHVQRFDLDGFLGRARSSGYIPPPGAAGRSEAVALLTDLFLRHQRDGVVEFHYLTRLFVGRLGAGA